jgi:uncharacterized membrane protein HdeD (DUF308 family)
MDKTLLFRLISAGITVAMLFLAWRRKDRRGVIDWSLIAVAGAALLIPETQPGLRYGIAGVALTIVMVRAVKRDLIDGSDSHARMMTIGILGFVASLILVASLPSPPPTWAKYVVIVAAVVMMVALLRPLVWMTRLLFSAHRLVRDLKHSRPPREADEKVLGIDLAPLRQPRK